MPETIYELFESEHKPLDAGGGVRRRCFLQEEGRAVAFVDFVEAEARLELWDIEVREEDRGRGHVRRIIDACEARFGKALVHEGGYTPEGFARVAHLFLTEEGKRQEQVKNGLYPSTTFVVSWEDHRAKYPLRKEAK